MAKSMRSKREKRLRAIRRELVQTVYDQKEAAKRAVQEAARLPVKPTPEISTGAATTSFASNYDDSNMGLFLFSFVHKSYMGNGFFRLWYICLLSLILDINWIVYIMGLFFRPLLCAQCDFIIYSFYLIQPIFPIRCRIFAYSICTIVLVVFSKSPSVRYRKTGGRQRIFTDRIHFVPTPSLSYRLCFSILTPSNSVSQINGNARGRGKFALSLTLCWYAICV